MLKDYYAILQVHHEASKSELKAAYRRLAFLWHPDRHPGGDDDAHQRFLELGEAQSVLTDRRARERYDRDWIQYFGHQRASASRPENVADEGPTLGFADEDEDESAASAASDPGDALEPKGLDLDPEEAWEAAPSEPASFEAERQISMREYRTRCRRLAVALALGDPRGRWVDLAFRVATAVAVVVALGVLACVVLGLPVPAWGPPQAFAPPFFGMVALVLGVWTWTVRERRCERNLKMAETVIRRQGYRATRR